MYLIFGCGNDREVVLVAASVKAVGGLDWMTRPTQVNCCKHRQTWRAKDAVRLQPKWYAAKLLVFSMRAHGSDGCRCSKQGLNHPSLLERNMVNPAFRLVEADDPARGVVGMKGRGTLEKAKAVR